MPATNAYVTTLQDQVHVTCSYIQLHCKVQEYLAQKQTFAHLSACLDEQIFISFKYMLSFAKYFSFFSMITQGLYRYIQNTWEYKSTHVLIHFFPPFSEGSETSRGERRESIFFS